MVEAFFSFDTDIGHCRGIVQLCPDPVAPESHRAWTLLMSIEDLKGHEAMIGDRRRPPDNATRDFRAPNRRDRRTEAAAFTDREPTVLVVGAGQAGLAAAACLTHLGVDTLVVERHARIGDNWRDRYHALSLHNQVHVNHLPYMPFPPTWPTYIPKDMLGDWFEAYAAAMELNVWTGVELAAGDYMPSEDRWRVTLRGSDGAERNLRPRHVIMATGVNGIANRPTVPGLDQFTGPVLHSSEYSDGADWAESRAIVIGCGNSGHDISQDLVANSAEVVLVQRSPTLVVNVEPSAQLPYALYREGPSLEDCDLLASSFPTLLAREAHQKFTEISAGLDKPLLDRLEKVGFRLGFGEDRTGWQFLYLTRGGDYYFNVGCSNLIADGIIRLVQNSEIECFSADGARLITGELIAADLVDLATGYKGQEHLVAKLFGQDVAEHVGPIWGFGDGQELRNMYVPTAQPRLWFIAGSFAQCRINSKYLAFQIKAIEEHIVLPCQGPCKPIRGAAHCHANAVA